MQLLESKKCFPVLPYAMAFFLAMAFAPHTFGVEQLYLAWKANDSSNRIISSGSGNGSTWPNGNPINTKDSTSAGPAMVSFKGMLYLFWKANDSSNRIFFSTSDDGKTWQPGTPINKVDSTTDSPAAIIFNDKLYVVWKANDSSNHLYYSASADGQSWPNGKSINTVDSTSADPAAAVFNNELYVIWKASDSSNRIWYSASADGVAWPRGTVINNTDSTSAGPAASAFGGKLYIAWKANSSSNRIYYSASSDGVTWPAGATINKTDSTSASPALAVFNSELAMAWKSNDSSNRIYSTASSDGATWPSGKPINGTDSTSAGPAFAVDTTITLEDLTVDGPGVPGEIGTGISHTDLANFAWRSFIAVSNYAAAPLPKSRGISNPSTSFADSGQSGLTDPLLWQTLAHRTELFPKGGAKPASWGTTPQYTYNENVEIPSNVDYTLYNNLDEGTQIGQNTLFFPRNPPNPAKDGSNYDPDADIQVLFEAKVNETEYNYVLNGKVTSPVVLPNGSLEVKAAWRKLTPDMDASRYHTAKIINYTGTDKDPVANNDVYALIALHIIHKTPNYPTFIFATFEQIDAMKTPDGKDTGLYFVTNYKQVAYEGADNPPTATFYNGDKTTIVKLPVGDVNKPFYDVPSGSEGIPVGQAGPVKVVQPATVTTDVTAVNNHVAQLMNGSPAFKNSVWKYYRLKGVQGMPTDTSTNLDFYLANIVVESSRPGIQLFQGNIAKAKPSNDYTFTNTRGGQGAINVSFPSLSNPLHEYVMGGCMGCHGVAQQNKTDFSFLFLEANGMGFSNPDTLGLPATEVMLQRAANYGSMR